MAKLSRRSFFKALGAAALTTALATRGVRSIQCGHCGRDQVVFFPLQHCASCGRPLRTRIWGGLDLSSEIVIEVANLYPADSARLFVLLPDGSSHAAMTKNVLGGVRTQSIRVPRRYWGGEALLSFDTDSALLSHMSVTQVLELGSREICVVNPIPDEFRLVSSGCGIVSLSRLQTIMEKRLVQKLSSRNA